FLSGLFEGDALIQLQGKSGRPRPHIEYTSASAMLAKQLVAILLRLGIYATMRVREKHATATTARRRRSYYSVYIYGSAQLRHVAEHLSFVGEKRHALEALRETPGARNPHLGLVPGATPLVREAATLAGIGIERFRGGSSRLAAYAEGRCEASRNG